MKSAKQFRLGIETLLADGKKLLRGKRVGLLAHPASLDTRGCHSSVLLREACGKNLVALFGPEHGFYGAGGAGELIGDAKHPAWGIPIHSLYGDHRRPTEEMLRDIDVLVFDLQDIGVRCYTFVSTLRYVMEECARHGKTFIVCDRPIPFPNTVDGPMLDAAFESFVACVPMPLVYGMTPAESARFLHRQFAPELDLHVMAMRGYGREEQRSPAWGPWISPSPGIRAWETVWTYPTTVAGEALPSLWYGRGALTPFQLVTAPWIDAEKFAAKMNEQRLPGTAFHPCWMPAPGVRIEVTNARRFLPVATGIAMLAMMQKMCGREKLWGHAESRPDFFDKLMGTDRVRVALTSGKPWQKIVAANAAAAKQFLKDRRAALLYS